MIKFLKYVFIVLKNFFILKLIRISLLLSVTVSTYFFNKKILEKVLK
jgi:hypothetical protein